MATFALAWYRSTAWGEKLNKPPGEAVSPYRSGRYEDVERVAAHINSIDPEMRCKVRTYG